MRKNLLLLLSLLLAVLPAYASHIRGGEITAARVAGTANTYDFTLTVYRDLTSAVNDVTNILYFGDGDFQESPQATVDLLYCSETSKITYKYQHTYNAQGQYTVFHYRDYRNNSVVNIGLDPGHTEFYVETQITIAASFENNTPVLNAFAVDIAGLSQIYVHNPSAYDPDGDSLSFDIAESRNYVINVGAVPIQGYQYPQIFAGGKDSAGTANGSSSSATLTIDQHKGLLKWDQPNRLGQYNVAIVISEWRFGRRIGYVVRDMQIIVKDVNNHRPIVFVPQDTCLIVPNSRLVKHIAAADKDSTDKLAITATGGLFNLTPIAIKATISPPNDSAPGRAPLYQNNPAYSRFTWQPGCEQVRREPYDATFKVQDQILNQNCVGNSLVDIKTWSIKVIGPAPDTLIATPGLGSIRLNWRTYICPNIQYFNIYRRIDSSTYVPDTCTTGVPPPEQYTLIGFTDGVQFTFLDDNNGRGLNRKNRYCYRITAVFNGPNGGESKESIQACAQLKLDIPFLINVSVQKTDSFDGRMFVRWTKPRELNPAYVGPYRYVLKRSISRSDVFVTVKSTTDLNDTTFVDSGINTDSVHYTYRVVFVFSDPNGGIYRDSADAASNIDVTTASNGKTISLSWTAEVPWDNAALNPDSNKPYLHRVYKELDGVFVKIDSVPGASTTAFVDDFDRPNDRAVTGRQYRYYVETQGKYSLVGLPYPLINDSYIVTVSLKDTVPPCPPDTAFLANATLQCLTCEQLREVPPPVLNNTLIWRSPQRDSCAPDLLGYNVYFKPHRDGVFQKILFTRDTFLIHNDNGSLAGCYRVKLVDSSGNESITIDSVCNDNCVVVELPNVVTTPVPGYISENGRTNAYWYPLCITQALITEAELKIYSRWGQLVYSSNSTDIRWPASGENPEKIEPGTYYYHLNVRARKLDDAPVQSFRGWIEVAQSK